MIFPSRRYLMAGAAALFLARKADALGLPVAPTRRTLFLGLRSSEMRLVTLSRATRFITTVTLEGQADAVSVGLANISPTPYRMDSVSCRQVAAAGAGPAGPWRDFTFGADGSPPARRPVTVPGNHAAGSGATNVPAILWSDWMPYPTAGTDPRPRLQLRGIAPPQTLPMTAAFPFQTSNALPELPARLTEEVEIPDGADAASAAGGGVARTPYAPIAVVRYRARVPGMQIVIGGDSHLSGWSNFVELAALTLSGPARPIEVWNTAWGGQPSNTFWPALDLAIDAAAPSIALIQGWTANDGMRPAADLAYLARVSESAERVRRRGGIPIIVKGLPRNLAGTPELASWREVNRRLDGVSPGAAVFDANPFVEDPDAPGNWRPGFSNDKIHPNLHANQVLAEPFARLLRGVI